MNELSYTIGEVLKKQLLEITQKNYPDFYIESFSCNISGIKTVKNSETIKIKYEVCRAEESLQNGEVELSYNEEKYPQKLKLEVKKAYSFNNTTLQNELVIESIINYDTNMSIKNISSLITGLVNVNYQTIKLDKYQSNIEF
jgi:hypothetical protein